MPLLNLDELYGPSYAGMNSVIQPLLHAAGRANVDPARVYLIGHAHVGPRGVEPRAALPDLLRRHQPARRQPPAATGSGCG